MGISSLHELFFCVDWDYFLILPCDHILCIDTNYLHVLHLDARLISPLSPLSQKHCNWAWCFGVLCFDWYSSFMWNLVNLRYTVADIFKTVRKDNYGWMHRMWITTFLEKIVETSCAKIYLECEKCLFLKGQSIKHHVLYHERYNMCWMRETFIDK